MMIRVLRGGLLTSLQDLGRFGYQQFGVVVGGAMDGYSHRVANLLVGNPQTEATLEMTLLGPTLEFQSDAVISICGGDLNPTVASQPVPQWKTVYVKKGCVIEFSRAQSGCRAYLAVAGGFDVPVVMDSQSTYLRAGFGGYQGRRLLDGDELPIRRNRNSSLPSNVPQSLSNRIRGSRFVSEPWSVHWDARSRLDTAAPIRVLRGREFDQFTAESRERLFRHAFVVSSQSDRMGYRLEGQSLGFTAYPEMISEGVTVGTLQVPPDGRPILLMADRQTTGGYPRIAQVVTVDISALAQVKPGDSLRFREVSLAEAQDLIRRQARQLKCLHYAIEYQRENGGFTNVSN